MAPAKDEPAPILASVILPTYNRADCLPATIDSVLAQSYSALEIVIMDDGSTDGTAELIASRYGHNSRVRYHRRANGGVSAARNSAIERARGEVLFFCDSDDIWVPNKLSLQMEVFARFPDVNLVWTDVSAVDKVGRLIHERYTRVCYPAWNTLPTDRMFQRSAEIEGHRVYAGNIFSTMFSGTIINMPAVAVRSSLIREIGRFDESMVTGEDYDFCLRACSVGAAAFLDAPTVLYRIGAPDQLTRPSLFADQARNWHRAARPFLDGTRASPGITPQRLRDILAGKYEWLGASELIAGNRTAARAALWESIRCGGRSRNVWKYLAMTFLPPGMETALRRVLVRAKGGRQPKSAFPEGAR